MLGCYAAGYRCRFIGFLQCVELFVDGVSADELGDDMFHLLHGGEDFVFV